MAPRDAEEQRIHGGTVTPTARDLEEKRLQPGTAVATPTTRTRDAEEARIAAGQS
jgi:hypothetical protein